MAHNMTTYRKNINGICYILDEENKTASVCSLDDSLLDDTEHYEGHIQIPSIVTYIERYRVCSIFDYAFAKCKDLTDIILPDSVTSIGVNAFRECTNLTSITIPNNIQHIGSGAFADTPWYNAQPNGLIYIGKVLYAYKGKMPHNTTVVVEDGTISISDFAFKDCTGLTSIIIPNSVTSIDNSAFDGCENLQTIYIPHGMTDTFCKMGLENLRDKIVEI